MAKIRCKECRSIAEETETYCPECGAIFMPPFNYVEEEEKAVEKIIEEKKAPTEKTFEDKVNDLEEVCHDIRDELVKIHHLINEKANECMRCFTASGIAKVQNFDDNMGNIVYKRKENIEDVEMLLGEYRRILERMDNKIIELEKAKDSVANFKTNNV